MDDNNLGTGDDINNLINSFDNFNSNLQSDTDGLNIVESARRNAAESLKKEKAAREKLIQATQSTVNQMYGMAKQLSGGGGSNGFQSLNTVIDTTTKVLGSFASVVPVVGGAFEGMIKGAGEVAKFITGEFSKSYGIFEKLADTGVISTFEQMTTASASLGLTFGDTDKILSKYSTQLAKFGGSALEGTNRLQDIAFSIKDVNESFQVLGISAADFADFQMGFIEQQQMTLLDSNLTDKQLSISTVNYIEQLDTLSKITGISRKDLQDMMMERTRDARYLAGISRLGKTTKDNIDSVVSQLSVLDPDFAKGMQDLIASEGAPTTEKSKAVLLALGQGGMDAQESIRFLRQGGDPKLFMTRTNSALKSYEHQMKDVVKYVGSENVATKSYIAAANAQYFSIEERTKIENDIIKNRKSELENTDSQSKKLAKTRRELYNSSRSVELLATGSKTMSFVMDKMSSGIESVIGTIYDVAGGDGAVSEVIKLQKQQRSVRQGIKDDRKKLAESIKQYNELIKEKSELDPDNTKDKAKLRRIVNQIKFKKEEIDVITKDVSTQESTLNTVSQQVVEARNKAGFDAPIGPNTSNTSNTPNTSNTSNTQSNVTGLEKLSSPVDSAITEGSTNQGIAAIRELIASVESNGDYNILVGGKRVDLENMTISQVQQYQRQLISQGQGSAAGKYQYIYPTLKELIPKLGLDPDATKFNKSTQDAFADYSIKMRGYDRYKSGKITNTEFLNNLSKEWAGLPSPERGGSSYYGGVANNASHIDINTALQKIGQARTGGIFKGPSTGYLAMLHGDEAVIPANDGSSSLNFMTSMNDDDDTEITNIFSMITEKVDEMIDLNKDMISIQNKFSAYDVK